MRRTALFTAVLCVATAAESVEVDGLSGHDDLFGRYAPGGDCKRQPRITVDASGIVFDVAGKTEKATKVEYVLGFYGPDYQGIQKIVLPFKRSDGEYAIMMEFNAGEKPGALAISGHGEGYPGGPPFSPRNKALAGASPYARCP